LIRKKHYFTIIFLFFFKNILFYYLFVLINENVEEVIKNVSLGKSKLNKLSIYLNQTIKIIHFIYSILNLISVSQSFIFHYIRYSCKKKNIEISKNFEENLFPEYKNYDYYIEIIDKIIHNFDATISILIIFKLIHNIFLLHQILSGINVENLNSKSIIYKRWKKFIFVMAFFFIYKVFCQFVLYNFKYKEAWGLDYYYVVNGKYPKNILLITNFDILLFFFDAGYIFCILYMCPVRIRKKSK